jgi:RNA polymerase sigma factor (sigma-70 family)
MPSFLEESAETSATSRGSAEGLSEGSLVEAAKRGHSAAFDTITEPYRKQLFRAAHRITRSCEDAEDAVQDALLSAFLHVKDFNGRSSFGTWLTRIAINSALMILRKKRASWEIATDCNDESVADGLLYKITEHQPNPERRCAQREEEAVLKKAIESLRPALRVVVQIQQLQERSMREAAKTIGISVSATKGRLFHAKKALRKSLIPKLRRMRSNSNAGFALCPRGNGSGGANARAGKQQSNHKEEGDEYGSKSKETEKYGAPTNRGPSGDGRRFRCEPAA